MSDNIQVADTITNTSPWAAPYEPKTNARISLVREDDGELGVGIVLNFEGDIEDHEKQDWVDLVNGIRALILTDPGSLLKAGAIHSLGVEDAETMFDRAMDEVLGSNGGIH